MNWRTGTPQHFELCFLEPTRRPPMRAGSGVLQFFEATHTRDLSGRDS